MCVCVSVPLDPGVHLCGWSQPTTVLQDARPLNVPCKDGGAPEPAWPADGRRPWLFRMLPISVPPTSPSLADRAREEG